MRTLRSLLAVVLLATTAASTPAWACGGCFVPPIDSAAPILQNAERILFVRDPATKKSTVWVEIRYSGPADGFGWVLPLPKVPKVGVGTSYLFDRLDLGTAPRFELDSLPSEGCNFGGGSVGCGSADSAGLSATAATEQGGGGGVTVLQHDQVGPYDYQVIQGKTADDVQNWLNTNGFDTPAKAKSVLADHVAKGDVFVAVKLATGKGVDQIKPISLEMDDAEPCVPLKLTSIAAESDTTIQVYVAGPGRAIPKNHLHVRINPVRLDVLHGAKNYEQVVAAAIDEAAGRAFITEFAGEIPTVVKVPAQFAFGNPTEEPLVDYTAIDTSGIAKTKTVCDALADMQIRKLPFTKETVSIIDPLFKFGASAGATDLVTYYKNLNSCPTNAQTLVDGAALAAALEKEFAGPLRDMTKALTTLGAGGGAKGRFTRMVMRISPDEMTRDPVFAFSGTLPNVSNVTKGGYGPVCLGDNQGQNGYRVTIAGLGSWLLANQQQSDGSNLPNLALDPRMTKAPAALTVELLDETGDPIAVDASQIALADQAIAGAKWGAPSLPQGTVLKAAAKRWTPPASDAVVTTPSSGCIGGTTRQQAPWALAALLGLTGLAVHLRRKSR
ncbi:MAG: DUF2330 domain-containing protein [Deltaproteobacteria bacterium]|nr:DUF2330 domain-containing protein [Deltaproteobacteria bacterium]